MLNFKIIVPDTSILIERALSDKIKKKELRTSTIIIHEAVLGELEHQANIGKAIGYLGLDEIKELNILSKTNRFKLIYAGRRPSSAEIKHASLGEIDSLIRDLAYEKRAVLVTGDKVQSKVAEAKNMLVHYIEPVITIKKSSLDKYFDEITMSVHLRESSKPYGKKGSPGNWKSVELSEKELTKAEVEELSKSIIEEAKSRQDGFIEMERRGSTIVQLGKYRIVITRPPFSDAWEITAVHPIVKLNLEDYHLSDKLFQRISEQAEGVLIAGAPGEGKSTCAAAIAEYYASLNKNVKTVESPRDLDLSNKITQYSLTQGSIQEIHDVLLLCRPDYTIFDEMRNLEDFRLFTDLRLAGIGFLGVVHGTNPIDAIQRFIGKTELGIIPHIIDTVIFIKAGQVNKVLSLNMTVKVPSGMTEEDLSRPVIEIKDFETNNLEYEMYSYGEETVVIPIKKTIKKSGAHNLASKQIESRLRKIFPELKAEVISDHKAIVYLPEKDIPAIIGKQGKNISQIESELGIKIEVSSYKNNLTKQEIEYSLDESHKYITLIVNKNFIGRHVDAYYDDEYLFGANVGKKGDINLHKKSEIGKKILSIFDKKHKIKLLI
ncbi:Flp pilus assembly complex ATPase component TadA [Candidatus Woesearchaeota archaeon]|nr:Flp pilus assembly complex ATPase component TadA [Candidatus Woesearchaeota archaeon]